jgi:hypothetical protein
MVEHFLFYIIQNDLMSTPLLPFSLLKNLALVTFNMQDRLTKRKGEGESMLSC